MSFLFNGLTIGTTTFSATGPTKYYDASTTLNGPQHTLVTTPGQERTSSTLGDYRFTAFTLYKDLPISGTTPTEYEPCEIRVEIKVGKRVTLSSVDAQLDLAAQITDSGRLDAMLRGRS